MNLQESIRRILREDKDHTNLLKGIIDSSDIFDYKYFCGFDIITPEERSDQYNFLNKNKIPYLIKVYFVGGPNSEVWPRTQAIRNKELDLMEDLHEYIKSFVPFNIEMMGSHVNSCDGYEKLMKRKHSTDDIQESIKKILKEESDEVMNMQSKILSQFRKQDQMERNEYSKFVQSEFGGDYERGAKEYAKIKNRNSDDIFGDKKRIKEFILINFDFNTFSSKDWENYWLLSQHSDNHPEFQKNALNIIKQNLGEDNEYYEYLHDRISCRESGTQIYGTQSICKKSKMNLQESSKRMMEKKNNMKIKSIKVIKGNNKWSDSKEKLIHMVLDLGEFEQKPSNKIDGFYERIKKHLPSLKSHRCSLGRSGGFFQRVKEGTWMGHIIEHVALELQTLAGYDTGWGRTRGVKGQKGVYNVVFNFEDEECGKLAAKEAFNVVNDIINNKEPKIEQIVKKLKPKTLKESIKKILREEDYSPAGKEITPNKIVVHKSNPMFRDKIIENGLKVRAGECYKIYVGYGVKCKPAIFATNSTNKRAWFDSTYDDDIWEINTEMIPDVKWYKDRHFESRSKHIVTFQDIPKEAITLKYEGTGSGDVKKWDKDSPNIVRESIRKVLKEETEGIDSFLDEISSKHNMSDELKDFVKQFIEESDCKRINFSRFKMGVMGLALESGVLINSVALNHPLPFLLFLIFHEVAHQYQFKKYGEDVMYDCYLGEISEREAAEFMKHTEEVADDFAFRKIRQLQKLNLIGPYTPPQMYKNVPIQQITMMVNNYRNDMRRKNIDSPKKVSEYFYNMVKSEL